MSTYDPREDDDLLAAHIDDMTAATEHAELVRWAGYAEEDHLPDDAEDDVTVCEACGNRDDEDGFTAVRPTGTLRCSRCDHKFTDPAYDPDPYF